MDNHILEGSYPDTIPTFTPRDANPNHQVESVITMADAGQRVVMEKSKTDVSPPGTPAADRKSKRQKLKAGAGSEVFTKVGFFHCKEGTPIPKMILTDLTKKYYGFCCSHNKKCSKPHQACEFDHVGRWDKVAASNQSKILEHCHDTKGKKVWLEAGPFTRHKVTILKKFAYLFGDLKGPKSA
jgi:hypothetical protein